MNEAKHYDILVIGAGGGTKLVSPPAKMGLKVAVIDKEEPGGTCLNRGCIPSKMLIHPADMAAHMDDLDKFYIKQKGYKFNFKKLTKEVTERVSGDAAGIATAYDAHPNIDFYPGFATFKDNQTVTVNGQELTADKIFIAVGSRPSIPQIPGLEGTPYWTSREALRPPYQPKKLLVIGGGYIATELGHFYGAFDTDVEFIVRSGLVSAEDAEIREEFTRAFMSRYTVHLGMQIQSVEYERGVFFVKVIDANGKVQQLHGDALLVATGIRPNSDTLALENTDIRLTEHGYIEVDDYLQTSVSNVWALGDCIGNHFFRHSVNFEGEYLFRTLIESPNREPIDYPPMPHAIFSYPQVGGVGRTEEELIAQGRAYIVGRNRYEKSAMGMALKSEYGLVKLLFDTQTKKLLGAHIVGEEASDMIHMCIAYMNMGGTLDDMLRTIYIHPALPENVRNAARDAKKQFDSR
jgi:dihydrolipoamide dehydrogenase